MCKVWVWVYEERRNGFAKKSKFKNKILARIRANRFFLIPLHNLLTIMPSTVCDATYKNYQNGFCNTGTPVPQQASCPVPAGYPNSQTAASHTSGCPLYNAISSNIVSTPKVMSFGSNNYMCAMSPYLATKSPNCPAS